MKLRHLPHYTYEDYTKWQGDWELIEGVPYAMASPKFPHQRLMFVLARLLEDMLEECDCFVVGKLDWVISEDTVVRPDLVVLCEEPQDYIRKRPEVVFEIVSENSREMDEFVKFKLYEQQAVPYYVLLYPEGKSWKAYRWSPQGFVPMERLSFSVKGCAFEIDTERLWR
ncbi:Uma2 family endonuclease [Pampinifervens florentissimum]|uniref:Uma2 family endonuclease n=1 Tax=Pampinifervens florentissimum TaxID=1632019 RepID=UPI0013B47B0B|nr:Uma2 family endonuclease [Hydrogenobacter sp. T-8]QID32565.1 Uma2 family endonuclease [Hydrogenobacter sp. T-8]